MISFYAEFLETLRWRPWQALVALYWHVTRRRVRARNWLRRDWTLAPDAYQKWIRIVEDNAAAAGKLAREAASWNELPLLTIVVDQDEWNHADLENLANLLIRQPYSCWELLLCSRRATLEPPADPRIKQVSVPDDLCALEVALETARGSHIWPLPVGTRIPETACLHWVAVLRADPEAAVVYADEDHLDADLRRTLPWLKPLWNREMLLSQDYISGACLLSVAKARTLLPLTSVQRQEPVYALLLDLTRDRRASVTKVHGIQSHRLRTPRDQGQMERIQVLTEHLKCAAAEVESSGFGSHRIIWPLPPGPPSLVSIIVPTKDKVHLLRDCIESVLAKTTWPAFEILVVDNNSTEQDTFAYFEQLAQYKSVSVIADRRPYNFSAINNSAVALAKGDYICMLNNDTEVISADWLEQMMRHATRSHVGAVGAKLLYPDGTIQHAGVVIGMGNAAGHAHRGLRNTDPGYFAQAHVTREATALTAACLLVEKRKYLAVGGLDADRFAIAYNDVDLCLKLRKAGLTNIYVPAAELFHYESVSRGDDLSPQHRQRYMAELKALQARWDTETWIDPLHHPMLDRTIEHYALSYQTSPAA